MKAALPIFLLLLMILPGCFEVREEVDLYADGSGRVSFTINLSESRDKVANYMRLGSWNGREVPSREEMESELAHMKQVLAGCAGISEVRTYADFDRFIFSLSARFDQVKSLDRAVNKLVADLEGVREAQPHLHYDLIGGSFRRHFDYPMELVSFGDLTPLERYMLESARVVTLYRFQKPIREYVHPASQLAPNQRALRLEVGLGGVLNGSATLANTIGF